MGLRRRAFGRGIRAAGTLAGGQAPPPRTFTVRRGLMPAPSLVPYNDSRTPKGSAAAPASHATLTVGATIGAGAACPAIRSTCLDGGEGRGTTPAAAKPTAGGGAPIRTHGIAHCELRPARRRLPPARGSPPIQRFIKGRHAGRPMSTQQVSRLESLIIDKLCRLDYVSKAAYVDDGREVTVLLIHDFDPDRLGEMIRGIGNGGTAIEDELDDRTVLPLAIHDGPDLPAGILFGHKVIYERETAR